MIFRAKYVVQSTKKFFENGAVRVEDGRVADVGKASSPTGGDVVDFGECAIVPGFVNAHTHLHFSSLRGAVPHDGVFAHWLQKITQSKNGMQNEDFAAATLSGLRESVETGTTTLANVSGEDAGLKALAESGMNCFAFLEAVSFEKFRAADALETLGYRHDAARRFEELSVGVAPHAPYSVSPDVIAGCARFAAKHGLPLSVHAGETAEEAAFLMGHDGGIASFLRDRDISLDEWEPPHLTPVKYLASLGAVTERTLLVHCNYLTQDEVEIIKKSGAHVIYCPRSSAFFGHADHPLLRLMEARVNVALGTDSLASNATLSVLDEVKFLARKYRKMFPAVFWDMAAINGAAALGVSKKAGTLEKKKSADMAVIDIAGCSGRSPLEMAVDDKARVVAAVVRGKILHNSQA